MPEKALSGCCYGVNMSIFLNPDLKGKVSISINFVIGFCLFNENVMLMKNTLKHVLLPVLDLMIECISEFRKEKRVMLESIIRTGCDL